MIPRVAFGMSTVPRIIIVLTDISTGTGGFGMRSLGASATSASRDSVSRDTVKFSAGQSVVWASFACSMSTLRNLAVDRMEISNAFWAGGNECANGAAFPLAGVVFDIPQVARTRRCKLLIDPEYAGVAGIGQSHYDDSIVMSYHAAIHFFAATATAITAGSRQHQDKFRDDVIYLRIVGLEHIRKVVQKAFVVAEGVGDFFVFPIRSILFANTQARRALVVEIVWAGGIRRGR